MKLLRFSFCSRVTIIRSLHCFV